MNGQQIPRIAFFADSYHEVNGVALTSREFAGFARRRGYPFFSVHSGPETRHWIEGSFETFELSNSSARWQLERDLAFDFLFLGHRRILLERLRAFQPGLVHITGPSHPGLLGAILAHDLGIPLVASWHTNVHEFAARRLSRTIGRAPELLRDASAAWAEQQSLAIILRFYQLARVLFAPNQELIDLLESRTGRPAYLMQRGIDTQLFRPIRRTRTDRDFVIGYVGRLSPEKNVRFLKEIEDEMLGSNVTGFRFLIVGEGSERSWLKANLRHADLPGILRGEQLAEAYANMDLFAFPSETDTFGNVVLEAAASGVPAVVTTGGGPKFLVADGVSGAVASGVAGFVRAILQLMCHPALLAKMRLAARDGVLSRSWDAVFEGVCSHYPEALVFRRISRSEPRTGADSMLMLAP